MAMSAIVNPGNFKARRKDTEKMLNNFTLYLEAFTHFLMVTDSTNATDEKKKSLLQAIRGHDMAFLFKHVGRSN